MSRAKLTVTSMCFLFVVDSVRFIFRHLHWFISVDWCSKYTLRNLVWFYGLITSLLPPTISPCGLIRSWFGSFQPEHMHRCSDLHFSGQVFLFSSSKLIEKSYFIKQESEVKEIWCFDQFRPPEVKHMELAPWKKNHVVKTKSHPTLRIIKEKILCNIVITQFLSRLALRRRLFTFESAALPPNLSCR